MNASVSHTTLSLVPPATTPVVSAEPLTDRRQSLAYLLLGATNDYRLALQAKPEVLDPDHALEVSVAGRAAERAMVEFGMPQPAYRARTAALRDVMKEARDEWSASGDFTDRDIDILAAALETAIGRFLPAYHRQLNRAFGGVIADMREAAAEAVR